MKNLKMKLTPDKLNEILKNDDPWDFSLPQFVGQDTARIMEQFPDIHVDRYYEKITGTVYLELEKEAGLVSFTILNNECIEAGFFSNNSDDSTEEIIRKLKIFGIEAYPE